MSTHQTPKSFRHLTLSTKYWALLCWGNFAHCSERGTSHIDAQCVSFSSEWPRHSRVRAIDQRAWNKLYLDVFSWCMLMFQTLWLLVWYEYLVWTRCRLLPSKIKTSATCSVREIHELGNTQHITGKPHQIGLLSARQQYPASMTSTWPETGNTGR